MPACVHIWATHFGFVLKKEKKITPVHTEGRGTSALWEGSQRSCSGVFGNYQRQVLNCLSYAG